MKRLTEKSSSGKYRPIPMSVSISDIRPWIACVERLAEIENILGDKYNLAELAELVKAKQEGRYVELPCKVGDKVYCIVPDFDETGSDSRFCKFKIEEKPFKLHHVEFYGKTIFIDLESAEARLKGVQDDG